MKFLNFYFFLEVLFFKIWNFIRRKLSEYFNLHIQINEEENNKYEIDSINHETIMPNQNDKKDNEIKYEKIPNKNIYHKSLKYSLCSRQEGDPLRYLIKLIK